MSNARPAVQQLQSPQDLAADSCIMGGGEWHYGVPAILKFDKAKVKLKKAVFLDVTPCGSCKNRRFGGT
jgi:hypothetical protein